MVNFDFLEKCLGIVSPLHFVYDFLRKMFLMLYSIKVACRVRVAYLKEKIKLSKLTLYKLN